MSEDKPPTIIKDDVGTIIIEHGDKQSTKTFKLGTALRARNKYFAREATAKLDVPIFEYNEKTGIWKANGEAKIRHWLAHYLGEMYTRSLLTSVTAYIRDMEYDEDVVIGGPPDKIVLANGTFDLSTGKLEDFNPDDYQITSIPVHYDPEAECPEIEKFLKEVLTDDNFIRSIEEFAGYCLYKRYPIASILLLTGSGRNGKSTLLKLLGAFLGSENICAVSPHQLENRTFAKAQLFGKLANIGGDIPPKALRFTSTIKELTGGDLTTAERKNERMFSFYNCAKLIFSANQIPKTYDTTEAFFRRWRIIDFPNKFPKEDPNTIPQDRLLAKLTTPAELSGFFNVAVSGLKRYLEQGHLTGEKTVEEKGEDYLERSDLIQYFAMRYCYHDLMGFDYEKSIVYDLYVELCTKKGKRPEEFTEFTKMMGPEISYAISKRKNNQQGQKVAHWLDLGIDFDKLFKDLDYHPKTEGPEGLAGLGLFTYWKIKKEENNIESSKISPSCQSAPSSLVDVFDEPPDDVEEQTSSQSQHPFESKEGE